MPFFKDTSNFKNKLQLYEHEQNIDQRPQGRWDILKGESMHPLFLSIVFMWKIFQSN